VVFFPVSRGGPKSTRLRHLASVARREHKEERRQQRRAEKRQEAIAKLAADLADYTKPPDPNPAK
jgi:hypothetical protein